MFSLLCWPSTDDDGHFVEEDEDVVAGPGGVQTPSRTRRYRLYFYETGPLDLCTVFFYTMIWVVTHAVVKEFLWDVSQQMKYCEWLSGEEKTGRYDTGAVDYDRFSCDCGCLWWCQIAKTSNICTPWRTNSREDLHVAKCQVCTVQV